MTTFRYFNLYTKPAAPSSALGSKAVKAINAVMKRRSPVDAFVPPGGAVYACVDVDGEGALLPVEQYVEEKRREEACPVYEVLCAARCAVCVVCGVRYCVCAVRYCVRC